MASLQFSLASRFGTIRRSPYLPLYMGALLFVALLFLGIARHSQASEDAAHSPLIIGIGAWLLVSRWREVRSDASPGSTPVALLIVVPALVAQTIAQVFEWVTIAGYSAWLALVGVGYGMVGRATLARLWFPIAYMLLALPLPMGTTVVLTQDLRLAISDAAVSLLDLLDYPTARTGVSIYIDRYQLLVEEACSGLNSMISLTAIGLFYAYVRHGSNWRYSLIFGLLMVAIAMAANFVRVVLLMLVTYHFGNAAAQSFVHDAAGLILFAIALAGMFAAHTLLRPLRVRLGAAA